MAKQAWIKLHNENYEPNFLPSLMPTCMALVSGHKQTYTQYSATSVGLTPACPINVMLHSLLAYEVKHTWLGIICFFQMNVLQS